MSIPGPRDSIPVTRDVVRCQTGIPRCSCPPRNPIFGGVRSNVMQLFGDQAVTPEFGELSADVGAAAFGVDGIEGWPMPEPFLDVGVAEADDDVLAGHDGSEQG